MDEGNALRQTQAEVAALREEIHRLRASLLDTAAERQRVEARLQDTNRRLSAYTSLVQNAPNAIVLVDRAHHLVLANETFAFLHGLSIDEIVGKHLSEVIGRPHYDLAAPQLDRVFAGKLIEFYTWYNYPDRDRYMHVYYFPIPVEDEIPLIGVILTDMTERQRAEEALRDSEERFRAFSEASTEGIILHDQGRILEFNQSIVEHFGYTSEELLSMSVLDLTAPESREEVIRHILAGDFGPYEAVSLHKDGTSTIGEIRGRNIIYKGRPIRVVAMRDITILKQAQQQLEHLLSSSEGWAAEMDATLNAIADIVMIVDSDGRILRMNTIAAAMAREFGAGPANSLSEIVSLIQAETLQGESITHDSEIIERVFRGEPVSGFITVLHFPSGRTVWLSVSAGPIRLRDGRQIGSVFTASDITELYELQEQQKVFMHMVSHDLRNPLSIVQGHVQLLEHALEERGLNDQLRLSTEAIDRSTRRMNVMIEDLVDAARTEGKQLVLNRQPVELAPYLQDFLERSRTSMETERVCLDIPPDLPAVSADYDRLERIFTNLLSNALKYSDPGTPVLVRARTEDEQVMVSVSDQGRGIHPEDIPHLFERFYRGHQKRTAEGIGLGLYISRLLVEAHDGRIWVESELGKGSTFFFILPLG
ncbi:MAG: PAS domain-containing sensor histidine kinase [Armatimonadota bacterium]